MRILLIKVAEADGGRIPEFDSKTPPQWFWDVLSGAKQYEGFDQEDIDNVRFLILYDERSWIDKDLVGKKLDEDSEEVLLHLERVRPCTLEAIRMNRCLRSNPGQGSEWNGGGISN